MGTFGPRFDDDTMTRRSPVLADLLLWGFDEARLYFYCMDKNCDCHPVIQACVLLCYMATVPRTPSVVTLLRFMYLLIVRGSPTSQDPADAYLHLPYAYQPKSKRASQVTAIFMYLDCIYRHGRHMRKKLACMHCPWLCLPEHGIAEVLAICASLLDDLFQS